MKSFLTNKTGLCFALLGLLGPLGAQGQTLTTVTPLDFGVIAIRDYNVVGRVTLLPGGAYNYNANVYIHEPPVRGEYLIEDFPANSFYTVTFPPSVFLTLGPTNFVMDNLVAEPAVLITDINGDDTFYIIGRLQTLGGGISYIDGTYDTIFGATINF